jgi:hypothetical protein
VICPNPLDVEGRQSPKSPYRTGEVLNGRTCQQASGRTNSSARESALKAVTLTTFANVPWNAPYYERCGFARMSADDLTPGLLKIRREEAEVGFAALPRVCMRRVLDVVAHDAARPGTIWSTR